MTDEAALAEIRRLIAAGDHAAAEAAARGLLDRLPEAAEAAFSLAFAIHAQGRDAEAEPFYELALRHVPQHVSALNNLASILRRTGRAEQALARFRLATQADPTKPWLWSNYARTLAELGRDGEAFEAMKRAAALAPEHAEIQARLAALEARTAGSRGAPEDRAAATQRMWTLNPAVRDFDRMGMALRPYVERLGQPDYRSPTLTTDRHGFRRTVFDGVSLGLDQIAARPGSKGVICGASQALGYGVADSETLHSRLSARRAGGAIWASLTAPVSQLLQQRLAFELFAPPGTRYCVVMSGNVNVLLALLAGRDTSPYPPLFNVDYPWSDTANPVVARTDTLADGTPVTPIEPAFARALAWMCDSIAMLGARCRQIGCRLLFAHPMALPWTGKPLAPAEREPCDLYRIRQSAYAALVEDPALRPLWDRHCAGLRDAVAAAGGTYIELSDDPAFKSGDALFCDLIHPNAAGIEIVAARIAEWAVAGT